MIKNNSVILFQGDSVTDAERDREDPISLGIGFPAIICGILHATYPEANYKILNRGISGNRAADMAARWQTDCLDLKPDVLTILCGVNESGRRYDSNDPTPDDVFKENVRQLILSAKAVSNPDLVLITPFLIDINDTVAQVHEDVYGKVAMMKELAEEFNAPLIDLDQIFLEASKHMPMTFWAKDGVHPTTAGHSLIAYHWLKAAGFSL
ncbi:MAG: SGNH/GDSL hydrolase family protein [Oscillospiraceae bacterium]|nr:SGNH/GDSL hydrolase family protein [Oscillospiraceae bacterium]